MKTAIVYVSAHHQNTKKLVDAIAKNNDITLIDAASCQNADLGEFDIIGFASGIAYGKYYPELLSFMENNMPDNKKVFFTGYMYRQNLKQITIPNLAMQLCSKGKARKDKSGT